jgi:hypothetical protein
VTALQQDGGLAVATQPDRRLTTRPGALPAWPVTMVFVFFPLFWLAGVTAFLAPIAAAFCLFLMAVRGRIRLPRMWLAFVAYAIWMLASASMIDTGGRMLGFAQRWTTLVGAGIVAVYVFNAAERLTRRRLLGAMAWFVGWLAVGGYLGMVKPYARIRTPMLQIVPGNIAANDYVKELLSPRFAEVQQPYGASQPFVRPAAPFPYTNGWGHAFVLLLPLMVALWLVAERRTRRAVVLLVLACVPPALATLNRGIFVGVAVAAAVAAVRLRRHIRLGHVLLASVPAALLGVGVLASGALDRLGQRTSTSSTTADRASLYREAFERTKESPLLGYGAPRPSGVLDVSVGTQGQFWNVMFSHGFVGLALFLTLVWGLALVTVRTRDLASAFVHASLVVVSVTILFYGLEGMNVIIVMVTAALLQRPDDQTLSDTREEGPVLRRRSAPGVPAGDGVRTTYRPTHADLARRHPDVRVAAPGRPADPPADPFPGGAA